MKINFQVFGQNFEFSLRSLSDEKLHSKVKWLTREERNLLTPILHLLREVEARRLFSSMGYQSLFEYAMKECGYSEDQAARRISAMRLLKELPEIEEKISSGELTLSNLNQAQTLFRSEKKLDNSFSREEKLEVIKSLENKSRREAERIVLSRSSQPEALKPEKIRPISQNLNEVKCSVSDEVLSKIEKLKGLLAHSNPNISLAELLDKLCDLGIKEWDLGVRRSGAHSKKVNKQDARRKDQAKAPQPQVASDSPAPARVTVRQNPNTKRMHISNPIQREVWRNANSQCEQCGSTHALQIDHIIPKAKGGQDDTENLRLLCRNCNQRSAIEHYGQMKMDQHLHRQPLLNGR